MKKYLITIISFCIFLQSYAQKFELNVDAYSGLFHYSGTSTAAISFINQGNPDYTNNPYGSKNAFSYGGGLRLQYVTKGGFIAGLQADYELLRSKVSINSYQPFYVYEDVYYYTINTVYTGIPVTGQSYLQTQNINLSPYIGYRINVHKVKIDLMPGIDLAFNINAYDKGNATDANNTNYRTDYKLIDLPTDVRLRFGAAAAIGHYALIVSYAHGVTNLYKNVYSDSNTDAHSNLLRFGLSYRLF